MTDHREAFGRACDRLPPLEPQEALDSGSPIRGLIWGVALGLLFWGAVALAIWGPW
jgi:hypothetical protein